MSATPLAQDALARLAAVIESRKPANGGDVEKSYVEIEKYSSLVNNKETIKSKDLIIGATYKSKTNKEWIYLRRVLVFLKSS